jgi:hypothetical protein
MGWKYQVKINQVNFSYSPLEDRLLFRFNTLNKNEFRMWLTRSMSVKLLGLLARAVKITLILEQPGLKAVAVEKLEEFRREAVLAQADYAQPFSAGAEILPLGAQPILVADIIMDASQQVSVVTFLLSHGQQVNLSLNHDLGVAVRKLLSDVVDGLDWGLGIQKELPVAEIGNSCEKMMLH